MILVVSLNPALDVTHHVPGVDWSGVNRPRHVAAVPGGKGLNVARTLAALGSDVLVAGLAGGVTGEAVLAGLAGAGVPGRFVPIAGETRRTFAVVDLVSREPAAGTAAGHLRRAGRAGGGRGGAGGAGRRRPGAAARRGRGPGDRQAEP